MKTGYIEPYQTTESRSQVIVIVFDDWSVICYDSYLRILWKKLIINTMKHPLLELLLNHYHIDEVSLYIAPLQIKSTTTTSSSSSATEENESSSSTSSAEQNSGSMMMMNHGVVIIGANMIKRKVRDISHLYIPDQLKFHMLDAIDNDFNVINTDMFNNTKLRSDSKINDDKDEKDIEEKLYSKLQHYNVYTLNGLNGEILWKHNGEEIKVEQYSKSLPQHAYQLNIGTKNLQMKTHHSIGINDWTIFRRSFIDELPHSWYSNEYTGMRIAHFVRRHIGASAALYSHHHHHKDSTSNNKNYRYRLQKQKEQIELQQNLARNNDNNNKGKNRKSSSTKTKYHNNNNHNFHPLLNGEIKLHGLEETAELPHNAAEHTENPNVIVIHKKNGLEVIALRTGVPITSLSLLTNRVYADVDGDNVIDAIVILNNPKRVNIHNIEYHTHQYSSINNYKLQHCMLIVMSGLPAQSQLFNGSICSNRLSIHDPLFSSYEEENQHHPHHQHHQHHKNTQKNNNNNDNNNNHEDNYGKILEQPYLQEDVDYPSIMHTTPLILHKLNPKTKKESKIRDIIVYTHVGIVTSYSGDGTFNWQIRHAPKWYIQHKHHHHHDSESDIDGNRVDSGNIEDVNKNNHNDHDDDDLYPIEAAAVAFDHDALRANNLGYHNNIYSHILLTGMIILIILIMII
jgi:hypothetical protein